MNVTHNEAFALLDQKDNILILTHRNPDGDAVGSMFALYYALKDMGKNVRCIIDTVSPALSFPVCEEAFTDFSEDVVVTVDVADKKLLTEETLSLYGDKVFLAIDHHEMNRPFAENLLLDFRAAAACEVIYDMLTGAGLEISKKTAEAMYLGIATDTGCFRYPNTTAHTLSVAASLVEKGVDNGRINREIFETKTKEYVRFETLCMNNLKTYFDGKCAVIVITQAMYKSTGTTEADTHSIAALPRQIEGVLAGVVIKEKSDGSYKISVRTNDPVSAADICSVFGGGGHRLAAGCEISGRQNEVVNLVLKAVSEALEEV